VLLDPAGKKAWERMTNLKEIGFGQAAKETGQPLVVRALKMGDNKVI